MLYRGDLISTNQVSYGSLKFTFFSLKISDSTASRLQQFPVVTVIIPIMQSIIAQCQPTRFLLVRLSDRLVVSLQ